MFVLFPITLWFVFGLWSGHLVHVLSMLECQFNCWHLPLTAFLQVTLILRYISLELWYETCVLAILIDFVLSMWHNTISYKICLNKIRFWLECMVLPSLSVSNLLMICLLQCNNPQEYEIHTGCKYWNMVWVYVFNIFYYILICIWTLEWTSGTCCCWC